MFRSFRLLVEPLTRLLLVGVLAMLAWIAIAACGAAPASAHEAMSGWRYPYQCCADNDCAELATSAVAETRAGYAVTVLPGTHPMWPHARADPLRLTVAYPDARPSPDGHFHLCLDHSGRLLCFFAAIGGS